MYSATIARAILIIATITVTIAGIVLSTLRTRLCHSHSEASNLHLFEQNHWLCSHSLPHIVQTSFIQKPPQGKDNPPSNDRAAYNSDTSNLYVALVLLSVHFHRVDVSAAAFEPSEKSFDRL
jgi:hypothetical protein